MARTNLNWLGFSEDEINCVVDPLSEQHALFSQGEPDALVFELTDGCYYTVFSDSPAYLQAAAWADEWMIENGGREG